MTHDQAMTLIKQHAFWASRNSRHNLQSEKPGPLHDLEEISAARAIFFALTGEKASVGQQAMML